MGATEKHFKTSPECSASSAAVPIAINIEAWNKRSSLQVITVLCFIRDMRT